jgi:hypothetical protein
MVVITSSSSGYQAGPAFELSRRCPATVQAAGDVIPDRGLYGIRNQAPLATA